MSQTRRLAAILAADVAGYSRLMGADEEGTLERRRRFGEAVPKLLLAIQEDAGFPLPYRCLAACYAHMGRLDEAQAIVERLRAISPVVVQDASFLRNPEHRELYLSGLRLAANEVT